MLAELPKRLLIPYLLGGELNPPNNLTLPLC